ncbi:MAG TPA: hypothetical protein VMS98_00490 [Thermoanaerobaculia bacterium]|nr:hypothetical protein [Thermoanaerobaculia bacterium]
MVRVLLFRLVLAGSLCVPLVAAPRLTFERTIPPPLNLGGATDLAVVYAIGDSDRIGMFLDTFIDQTNRSGLLRVVDSTGPGPGSAEVLIRIGSFTCRTADRSAEGSTYNYEGRRVKRRHRFVDAVCEARLELLNGKTRTRLAMVRVSGQGTSPRVDRLTGEEGSVALDQAARYTAISAADKITPRRVRETIALIEDAPRFSEGMTMIDSGRPQEARRIWEAEAKRDATSAALRFNLAALCEAAGDVPAAARHYADLKRLAPNEKRFRAEFEMFRRRNGLK